MVFIILTKRKNATNRNKIFANNLNLKGKDLFRKFLTILKDQIINCTRNTKMCTKNQLHF